MRKRSLVLLILGMLCLQTGFSQKFNKREKDPKNQKEMLVGLCTRAGLEQAPFNEWLNKEYCDYKADEATLILLKPLMKKVKIRLVMGTWCGDSRQQVPRFYRILDEIGYKSKKMQVICVDRDKKAAALSLAGFNILYVPTFIISRDGREIGRIVESPVESLEKDLLKILKQ